MDIDKLYTKLLDAYSEENLNKITAELLILKQNKKYSEIKSIANKISRYIRIEQNKNAKCFTKLMMLYHPDKGELYREEIRKLYHKQVHSGLEQYSHIFELEHIDLIETTVLDDNIDYNPKYEWDNISTENFTFTDEEGLIDLNEELEDNSFEKNFYNLIKIRVYGHTREEFPSYYLEDFEDFEMAYSGLESLDGIEYCLHAKTLDLSNNEITDLNPLWNLENINELFLSNNQISYIDALSNLTQLKILDISNNQINDISPLFELEQLEYVNLAGNLVPKEQIEMLKNKEILIVSC